MHTIRKAGSHDLEAIKAIMNHNILHSTAIYDYEPKSNADIAQWFADKQSGNWPVIVAEVDGKIIGFASYGTFRVKIGYKFTVEHSVYISDDAKGKGIGTLLLTHLIALAKTEGYHCMVGCIDASNSSSIIFHKKFGFKEAGIIKEVAYKFDRWLDLQFMQLLLK